MATINAQPGIRTAFAGGSDDIICAPVDGFVGGVQIGSEGLNLGSATIEVKGIAGGAWEALSASETATYLNVGSRSSPISAVRISGAAAGSYFLRFTRIQG